MRLIANVPAAGSTAPAIERADPRDDAASGAEADRQLGLRVRQRRDDGVRPAARHRHPARDRLRAVGGQAWSSLQTLNHEVAFGWFIRALHGWGSNFMIAIVLIHMVQVFLFGASQVSARADLDRRRAPPALHARRWRSPVRCSASTRTRTGASASARRSRAACRSRAGAGEAAARRTDHRRRDAVALLCLHVFVVPGC